MIGKNTIKQIKSLSQKKYRQKEKLFLVEGDKNIQELLHSNYNVVQLYATKSFLEENRIQKNKATLIIETTEEHIRKASLLKNPQRSLALCTIPPSPPLPQKLKGLSLYLDGIQNPGNLGTLIRICDWFGISELFCSTDTADLYNPKVIQSTMGSFCRVNVSYLPFEHILDIAKNSNIPILGTFLNGKNIYTQHLPAEALLIVGNEGSGIRKSVEEQIENKLTIPSFALENHGAESLNAAVATGIICAEFRRKQIFPS